VHRLFIELARARDLLVRLFDPQFELAKENVIAIPFEGVVGTRAIEEIKEFLRGVVDVNVERVHLRFALFQVLFQCLLRVLVINVA